jgi:prepilin-type processing-associated H-X9-DG protein
MYLTDYDDTGPPSEHRQEVIDAFNSFWGGGTVFQSQVDNGQDCHMKFHANPYMRKPVIFDPYIRNRDVWRCPSARLQGGAMFIYGSADWFGYLQAYGPSAWGDGSQRCPKDGAYPAGWGGDVTDTLLQDRLANTYIGGDPSDVAADAFVQSVATNNAFDETKMTWVDDAANYVIIGDGGACVDYLSPGLLAYPECCYAECNSEWCAWADWENCWDYCPNDGMQFMPPNDGSWARDPEIMNQWTRHLGGTNIGFLDGHAKWWSSRRFIDECNKLGRAGEPQPFGLWPWGGGYPQWCGGWDPGIATFYSR